MNNIELPLARLLGHGDVRILKLSELRALVEEFGLTLLKLEGTEGIPRASGRAKGLAVRAGTLRHAGHAVNAATPGHAIKPDCGHARTRRQTKGAPPQT